MEPVGSLPRTEDLIAGSYPELYESSLHLPIFKIIFIYAKFSFLFGFFNPLTPNDLYMSRTATLTSNVAFYIFIQQM